MKRSIALFAGIAALSSLMAARPAQAQQYVYGFSDGASSGNLLNLTLANTALVQAPLAGNPATGGANAFSGWYTSGGFNSGAGNDNYIVGNIGGGVNYANFMVYDLSQVAALIVAGGGVVSASEQINSFGIASPPETVDLWDINTPLATVDSYPINGGDIAIYNDLSSGNLYGSYTYDGSEQYANVDIALDAAFLTDINNVVANGGTEFGIGHSETAPVSGVPLPTPMTSSMVLLGILAFGRKVARRVIA